MPWIDVGGDAGPLGNGMVWYEDWQLNPQQTLAADGQSYDPNRVYSTSLGDFTYGLQGSDLLAAGGNVTPDVLSKAVSVENYDPADKSNILDVTLNYGGSPVNPFTLALLAATAGTASGLFPAAEGAATTLPELYAAAPGAVTDAPVFDTLASAAPNAADVAAGDAILANEVLQPGALGQLNSYLAAGGAAGAGLGGALATGGATAAGGAAASAAMGQPTAAEISKAAAEDKTAFTPGKMIDAAKDTGFQVAPSVVNGALGAAIGGASGSAASRALDAILKGETPSTADLMSLLGTGVSTGLGVYGSMEQANTLRDIAEQSRTDRAPFLSKSLEWLNNPSAYIEGPGKQSLEATLRALSVNGNPFGNPTSLALATDASMRNWQNAVTGFGNIGLSGSDSRNQLLTGAAGADANVLNAIGSGVADVTTPRTSLEQLLKQLKGTNFNLA